MESIVSHVSLVILNGLIVYKAWSSIALDYRLRIHKGLSWILIVRFLGSHHNILVAIEHVALLLLLRDKSLIRRFEICTVHHCLVRLANRPFRL
jgi:hypothetical protein